MNICLYRGYRCVICVIYCPFYCSLKTDLDSAKQHKGFVPVAHLKKVPKSAEAPLAEMKPSEKDRCKLISDYIKFYCMQF